MLRSIVLIAALAVAAPIAAAPRQPTSKWEVQYTASKCTAKRSFGDYQLMFEPAPLGKTTTFLVQAPGKARRARQYVSYLQIDDQPPAKISSLVFPLSDKSRRGMLTVLSAEHAASLAQGKRLRISVGSPHIQPAGMVPENESRMAADLAIGSTAALTKALDICMDDLRRHWGMVDGEMPKPAKPAIAHLAGIFRSEDYPDDALSSNNSGRTTYMMMVDENGRLMDCGVKESSGVATLDAMGCQVIRERAKFEPGYDAAGKPMKSIFLHSVTWSITG